MPCRNKRRSFKLYPNTSFAQCSLPPAHRKVHYYLIHSRMSFRKGERLPLFVQNHLVSLRTFLDAGAIGSDILRILRRSSSRGTARVHVSHAARTHPPLSILQPLRRVSPGGPSALCSRASSAFYPPRAASTSITDPRIFEWSPYYTVYRAISSPIRLP